VFAIKRILVLGTIQILGVPGTFLYFFIGVKSAYGMVNMV
jgi:hypothetical protein